MKRPLFVLAIVITAIVFLYLEFFLSDYLMDYPDSFDGSTLVVTGVVADKELKTDYLCNLIPVVYITPVNASIGKNKYIALYLKSDDYPVPMIGETIKARGTVRLFSRARNPGEFDESLYYATLKTAYRMKNVSVLARNGKENILQESLFRFRTRLESILDSCLDEEDSAIMKAILLGDKAFMAKESKQLYKDNGIIHILAVSGLHISLLGMGMFKLLRKLKLRMPPASVISIALMYMYGHMCGMSSSAFRAVVMFALRMLAPLAGRTYDMLSALAVAELMLLIDQPLLLYNSGFLFSFGAVIGIALIRPALEPCHRTPVSRRMHFADDPEDGLCLKLGKKILAGLMPCFSIFLATLPVYMSFYYTYPVYSVLLNFVVLPLMAPLMVLGIICFPAGLVSPLTGRMAAIPIHVILGFFEYLCRCMGRVPGRTWFIGSASKWKLIYYVLALLLFVLIKDIYSENKHKADHIIRFLSMKIWDFEITDVIRYGLMVAVLLVMLINPKPELRISMIDVDQGDGILIQSRKENILIDGGSTGKKNVGEYSIIPYLKYSGIGVIDAAIVTHEDQDHISGILEIMDDMENGGIRIKRLILPDVSASCRGDNYRKLELRADELKIPVEYISCGKKLKCGMLTFTCLNPEKEKTFEGANAYSTVLYMKYGSFTALFTGDVEKEGQDHITVDIENRPDMFENLTLLKVAHHGSMYTTDERFLKGVSPRIAFISCGRDNSYGHPHRELLERLKDTGAKVYRTDESGAVILDYKRGKVTISQYLLTS